MLLYHQFSQRNLRACNRVILGCLAVASPKLAGSPTAAARAVAAPPAVRAALRVLTLESVWRLLLAARVAGGSAQQSGPPRLHSR